MFAAFVIAGLAVISGSVAARIRHSEKIEHLSERGVPVTALADAVTSGTARTHDYLTFSYEVGGVRYVGNTICAGSAACTGMSDAVELRVDPADPAQFLADNGHTDDSGSVMLGWSPAVFGIGLLASAAIPTGVILTTNWRTKRQRFKSHE